MHEATRNKKHLYEMFLNKIKESPKLFIILWTIPPFLFDISKRIFGSYVPVLSFLTGCLFMIAMQVYILFKILDSKEEENAPRAQAAPGPQFFTPSGNQK